MLLNCGVGEFSWETARRSNQSILKEISPEYALEGLMLKLKLQHLSHLIRRTDSLEKTVMLGKIEGRRRRGHTTEWLNWTELGWLWGCFQKRLALESVDWVKQMAPPTWLGFIQRIEDLHKQTVRRENPLVIPSCLSWDISLLPWDWDLYHQRPLPNQFSGLWTWSRAHTLNSSSSQAFDLELN